MKIYATHVLALSLLLALYACLSHAFNVEYLPRRFKVYRNEAGVVQQKPEAGFVAKIIPNINLFRNAPGCYLACYSSDPNKGVYPVSSDAYLVGQIRVEGEYRGKVCYPKDIDQPIFSTEKSLIFDFISLLRL